MSRDVLIVSAVRTPIGKFGGKLAQMTSPDLGVAAAKAALTRAGVDPAQVEESIFGSARQAGNGPNPARQISVRSGVPKESRLHGQPGLRVGDEGHRLGLSGNQHR